MIFYLFIIYMMSFMLMSFFLSIYFLVNKIMFFVEYEFLNLFSVKMDYLILLDWISLMFISVVLLISSMVIFYSIEYMSEDYSICRFIYLVLLFVLSMILMIISPNMISILFGWDGLGLVSYCLVIFFQNENSFNSGMVTVLMNRIGDIMSIFLISLLIFKGSWNLIYLFEVNSLIIFLIVVMAFTKSAQIPFSSWLPMAMAAPTPVSSLVHSSTLVTAGVYLLIRLNYLFVNSVYFMNFIMLISIFTMFLSGLSANFEFDLKKIIALSTLSQLGVMMFSLSIGLPKISYFHLLTHAMFKSMLFMSAGVIIHNMVGYQDIRFLSMILYNMPIISMIFICSSFSLCGIPFMAGFFSKDLVLEMFLMSKVNVFILLMLFVSMGFTVMYTFRLIYYSFIKFNNLNIFMKFNNLSSLMVYSMFILYIMSIVIGSVLSWLLFSMKNLIYLTKVFKLLIFFFMLMGVLLGGVSIFFLKKIMFNLFYMFMYSMWFILLIYNVKIKSVMKFSSILMYKIDLGWNEFMCGGVLIDYFKKIFQFDLFKKNFFNLMILIMYMLLFIFLIF